eukprot:286579-Hanusia_phi.AAC.1
MPGRGSAFSYSSALLSQVSTDCPVRNLSSHMGSRKVGKQPSSKVSPAKAVRQNFVVLNQTINHTLKTQVIGFQMFHPADHGSLQPNTLPGNRKQAHPCNSVVTTPWSQTTPESGINASVGSTGVPPAKKRRKASKTAHRPSATDPTEKKETPVGARYQTCSTPDYSSTPDVHFATNALRQLDFPDGISGVAMKLQFPEASPGLTSSCPMLSSPRTGSVGGAFEMSGSMARQSAAQARDFNRISGENQSAFALQSSLAPPPRYLPQSAFATPTSFSPQTAFPAQSGFGSQPTLASHTAFPAQSGFGSQPSLSSQTAFSAPSFFPDHAVFPAQSAFAAPASMQAQHSFSSSNVAFPAQTPFPA